MWRNFIDGRGLETDQNSTTHTGQKYGHGFPWHFPIVQFGEHVSCCNEMVVCEDGKLVHGVDDPFGLHPWKRNSDGIPEGTFQGDVNALAQVTLLVDPNAKLADRDLLEDSSAGTTVRNLPNLLPDG